MALLAEQGHDVRVVFFTDGVGARNTGDNDQAIAADARERRQACADALKVLGVELLAAFDFTDNAMDEHPRIEIVQALEETMVRFRPDVVYTHHPGDLNIDHRRVHEAVMTACRPVPEFCVREVYCFEVASATGWSSPSMSRPFVPQRFVDITRVWEVKRKALETYGLEMRQHPHARSIEAIESPARYRGVLVGLEMAEAFTVERQLI